MDFKKIEEILKETDVLVQKTIKDVVVKAALEMTLEFIRLRFAEISVKEEK